jgi:hypothetical protein
MDRRVPYRARAARVVLAIVGLFAAGACTARKQEPPAPARSEAERLAALNRCAAAFGQLAEDRAATAAAVISACAPMRARPSCRAALAAATNGDGALAAMLGPCRAAYCPDLSEPRPAACTTAEPGDHVAAAELDAAIISLEYGISRDAAVRVSLFSSPTMGGRGTPIPVELPGPRRD